MFGADNAILDDARGENMEYTESPIMTDFYGAAWGLQLVPPHDLRGITCAPDGVGVMHKIQPRSSPCQSFYI